MFRVIITFLDLVSNGIKVFWGHFHIMLTPTGKYKNETKYFLTEHLLNQTPLTSSQRIEPQLKLRLKKHDLFTAFSAVFMITMKLAVNKFWQ